MSDIPSLDSIEKRLRRAQADLVVTLEVGGKTERLKMNELPPSYRGSNSNHVTSRLARDGGWQTDASAFVGVRDWVDVHWHTERATEAPAGTVITGDGFGQPCEPQLDATATTCKLIVAAAVYGAETIAEHAIGFASHGMVEVHHIDLLKGPSVQEAVRLDDYCYLLPYREAMRRWPAVPHRHWPAERSDNVCALESRSFERRSLHGTANERFTSPLLRYGPETLALVLGLVWRDGFRAFGTWRAVPAPVDAALPFSHTASLEGGSTMRVKLALQEFGPRGKQPPLAITELAQLMDAYAALPAQSQRILALAMRRLRDSTARVDWEDKVVDVCIALEALFMDETEQSTKRVIARRGSWYFAESMQERQQTRLVLKNSYALRSKIVQGNTPVVQHRRKISETPACSRRP